MPKILFLCLLGFGINYVNDGRLGIILLAYIPIDVLPVLYLIA